MSAIEVPGITYATADAPESAMPQAGIIPPQEVIPVAAVQRGNAREAYRKGAKRFNRPEDTRRHPDDDDPALSTGDQVLIALDEAVMRQVESKPPPEADHAEEWGAASGAHDEQHALNLMT